MKIHKDAFEFYASLGPARSYQAVADRYGATKRCVLKRATKERWQERLRVMEATVRAEVSEKAVESLEAMNVRHLKILQTIQGKALETLRSVPLKTAVDAVRALDMAMRQEREIRVEPGERSHGSVTEIIKREYQRWLIQPPARPATLEVA